MLLLLSLFVWIVQSETTLVIDSDSLPFVLLQLERNTCYNIDLDLKISCIISKATIKETATLAFLYINYGNTFKNIPRLESVVRGRLYGYIFFNKTFRILNVTNLNPNIIIERGQGCLHEPLILTVYKLDSKKIDCNNDSDEILGSLILFLLVSFSFMIFAY